LSSSPEKQEENQEEDVEPSRTTFDQAGASLIDEEDKKRMEEMGEFDSNPNVRNKIASHNEQRTSLAVLLLEIRMILAWLTPPHARVFLLLAVLLSLFSLV